VKSKFGFIYIIENEINDKLYVGRTLNVHKRKRAHFSKYSKNLAIKSAIEKYGAQRFDFVLLESCDSEEELNAREIYWIEKLSTLSPSGYNLKQGGQSGSPTEIVRKRMSVAHQGIPLSPEHRMAISQAAEGREVSAETRSKISKAHLGMQHAVESKIKMSKAKTGRKLSPETRLKMSVSHKGKSHGPMPEETRRKISLALQGRSSAIETRRKISRALLGNQNAKK
jgi:group I intron endonuclease